MIHNMVQSTYTAAQLTGILITPTNQNMIETGIKVSTISHGITAKDMDEIIFTDYQGRYSFFLVEGEYEIFVSYHKNWKSYGKLEIFPEDKNKVYDIQTLVDRYDKMHSDAPSWDKEKLFKHYMLSFVYPVGSIYTSFVNQSPAELLGGEWELLPAKYVRIADESHPGGFTGGADTSSFSGAQNITLTEANLPSHTHSFAVTGHTDTRELVGSFWDLTFSGQRRDCEGIISITDSYGSGIDNSGGDKYDKITINATHNHNINISGSLGNTGGNQPIRVEYGGSVNIEPPYITVYLFKRIK